MMIMMVVVEVGAKIKSPFDEPIMAKKAGGSKKRWQFPVIIQ